MNAFCKPLAAACLIVVCLTLTGAAGNTSAESIRLGVYDSRAVAIAYAPSKFNPAREKMDEFKRAQADGNKERMQELENWGQQHQRQLHRQGFALVPVGDLLDHVRDKLPEVADRANVVAITRACDFTSSSVELVDVTDELVKLFDPSEKTLKNIEMIQSKPAVDLDELEQHHSH